MAATLFVQPLDLVKNRMQLSGEFSGPFTPEIMLYDYEIAKEMSVKVHFCTFKTCKVAIVVAISIASVNEA